MSTAQWAVLAFAVVLVFWMVGAYNRLMVMRNAIGDAWLQVDRALKHRGSLLPEMLLALREPLAAEGGALDALAAAHEQAAQASAALAARPVAVAAAAHCVRCETVLAAAASRVLALVEQQGELPGLPAVAAGVATWREGQSQLLFARQLFDGAAQAYNEAAHQRPTRWLLGLFGFGPAGLLGS